MLLFKQTEISVRAVWIDLLPFPFVQGASILRMIQDWITPELFQKGCQVKVAPKPTRNTAHLCVTVARPLFKK